VPRVQSLGYGQNSVHHQRLYTSPAVGSITLGSALYVWYM